MSPARKKMRWVYAALATAIWIYASSRKSCLKALKTSPEEKPGISSMGPLPMQMPCNTCSFPFPTDPSMCPF